MKPVKVHSLRHRFGAVARATVLALAAAWSVPAAASSLADAPLFTGSSTAIKPNLMFILDDSGSMQWDFMPDAADTLNRLKFGRTSAQCNGLAYDPDQTYPAPWTVDGSNNMVSRGDADIATFTTANPADQTLDQKTVTNIKNTSSGNVSVGNTVEVTLQGSTGMLYYSNPKDTVTVFRNSSSFFVGQLERVRTSGGNYLLDVKVVYTTGTINTGNVSNWKLGKGEAVIGEYYVYTGSQPRLAWYKRDGSEASDSNFYKECNRLISDGSSVFTKVSVATLSAEKKQNYANWAKYYRTRMEAMQSSTSVAFKGVDQRYRVGYSTIGQPSAKGSDSDFLHIDDFTPAHKKKFYDRLYEAVPGSTGTPLRGALAKAGQYYANKAKNQDKDPIQYSCQRNFAILSTDGYWNEGAGRAEEKSSNEYGPNKFDRKSAVGNVDNKLPRPMADGNTLKSTTITRWSSSIDGVYQSVTGTDVVKSSKKVREAKGSLRDEERTIVTRGDACDWNWRGQATKWYKVTTKQRRTVTGTRESGTVTELRERTTVTTQTPRVQQVDYEQTVVVDNGATIEDYTKEYPKAPTDGTPVQTTQSETVGPTTKPVPGDIVEDDVAWAHVSSNNSCVSNVTPSTETKVIKTYPAPSNFGPEKTVTLPDRTEVVPATAGWATTPAPTVVSSAKESTAEYESKNGQSDTLADVAAFYYENDLRTATLGNCLNEDNKNVCANNVPGTSLKDPYQSFGDSARHQHMTTFTLGMGVSGSLIFDPRYMDLRSGDFHDIVNLGRNWPNTTSGQNSTVDDLWHAAVNGRGQYFSAGNPTALTAGLNTALASIDKVTGSASAASTSSLQPVAGDNDIFVAQFTTKEWIGDVLAYKIDENTGQIPTDRTWSAQARLELKSPDNRKIYYASATEKGLAAFTYDNLLADGYNFDNFCSKSGAGAAAAPAQCATLSDKTAANDGKNLVAYLRGDQTKPYYRTRTKRLGDIINASPLFVGKPAFRYTEHEYAKFANDKAGRTAVVLAAANDGMLHAFDRASGDELWAFVPSFVIPKLHKLADENFANAHEYFVDGSPQMGDIWDGDSWRTIVVGGLNKGGRGYYALDVTDPGDPELLWEFSDPNLGYTFGNPIITKRKNGTWVVVFASGYDNNTEGDGNGRLYVLDAQTGTPVDDFPNGIPTLDDKGQPVGTTAKPSGLARINSWVESELDNTSLRFYGGDELGNLWRFDLDGEAAPPKAALLLASFKLADGTPQPITTKPVVAAVNYNGTEHRVVYVATGSYMRQEDSKSTTTQSMYAVKDLLTEDGWGDVRKRGDMQVQTITAGTDGQDVPTRSSTTQTVDWGSKIGWRADFPVAGERVSVNPQLALDTIYVGSNLPKDEDCSVGGDSFLYKFDITTGQSTGVYVGNVLIQGLTLVQLTKGSSPGSIVTIITRSDGTLQTEVGQPPAVIGALRRTSWRELVD